MILSTTIPAHREALAAYLHSISRYYLSSTRPYLELGLPDFQETRLSPQVLLTPGARTLLLGAPGTGKTTLLDWTTLHAAQTASHAPIFASLRNYGSIIGDLLQVSVERFTPNLDVNEILSFGKELPQPAILLDGFDEVAPVFRSQLRKEILDLASLLPNSPFVVSSRPQCVLNEEWPGWQRLEIPMLSDAQVIEALSTVPRKELLLTALKNDPALMNIAKRPAFLFTMRNALAHAVDIRDYLLREIPRYVAWRGHTKSVLPASVPPPVIDSVLEILALDTLVRGALEFTAASILGIAGEVGFHDVPAAELAEAVVATDVITTAGPESYRFTHASLLESYCARAVAKNRRNSREDMRLFVAVLSAPNAEGICQYLIRLLSDAELRQVLDNAPPEARSILIRKAGDLIADRFVHQNERLNPPERVRRDILSAEQFATERDLGRKDILVIAVHGFNTRGDWKNVLSLLLNRETDGERYLYRPYDYGEFRAAIINPFARNKQIRLFQLFYNQLLNCFKDRPEVVFVAHSFGTYIVSHAIRRFPEVKCDRLLLLGSALPRSFDWGSPISRVAKILNIIGRSDTALRFARFAPGLGDAGRFGFAIKPNGLIEMHEEFSDHSDLFGEEYMRSVWIPFIRNGTAQQPTR